jgi:peptide deformylase
MQIIKLGDNLLREKALPVKNFDADFAKICAEMIELLHETRGVGLAGPQVGLMQRVFVVHVNVNKEEPRVFVNPSIIRTSEELISIEEGCLSLPGVWAEIVRPEKIKVQAWNEKGKAFTIEADGILARVILHEYDHLEGVLFVDHLPDVKRDKLIEKYEKSNKARAMRAERNAARNLRNKNKPETQPAQDADNTQK